MAMTTIIRRLNNFFHTFTLRYYSSIVCQKLVYDAFGDPASVLRLENETLEHPSDANVLVKLLASPINPADINTIQGVYPVKPSFPALAGNEGVGEIISCGDKVKKLKVGDWVVPASNAWGTWRTHALCPEIELHKIANDLDLVAAATITVNPCTAYRMLKDFVDLEPGDVVIQNGANSACGLNVIQLCKEWGFKTVNVVRNRSDIDKLKESLMSLGADFVVTDDELPSLDLFKTTIKKPKLGLNCVGGKNCLNLLRHIDNSGVVVTYGGMSREPVTVPTSALIFKDISFRGYWMTRWNKENAGSSDHVVMLSEIASLSKAGKLRPPPYRLVPLSDYKEALVKAMNISGRAGVKHIFDFS